MSLTDEINRPNSIVFRRAYIKRKSAVTGLYESTWQNITPYIIKWGTIQTAIDDVRLNKFTLSGITLQADNKLGKFNEETNINSLWHNYLTRYGTLVKIEAGYKTGGGIGWGFPWGSAWGEPWGRPWAYHWNATTELPSDCTQGIFIMDQEIPINAGDNKINLNCSSLKSIFEGVKANEVAGLGPTQTISELIAKIRDHTDGSGNVIFRQYISAASWDIQTTTNYYNIATSTALDNEGTVWDFMEKIAGTEGRVVYIDRLGHFHLTDRIENTTTSQFSFLGQGQPRTNIIRLENYKQAFNKNYNAIRLKYLSPDTTTSYIQVATSTVISPTNIQWKYGAKILEIENTFINNTATTQSLAENLFTEFQGIKSEGDITAKFHPTLDILDKVDASYYSYDLAGKTLWDTFDWDGENWAAEGENFDWDNKEFKILSKGLNLDDFSEKFHIREI